MAMNRLFKHFWPVMWLLAVIALGFAQMSIYYRGKTIDTLREHVCFLQDRELAGEPPVVDESIVQIEEGTLSVVSLGADPTAEDKSVEAANDKGHIFHMEVPCVVSSDDVAWCPLSGVNVHTKKHGPYDCPDGQQDYNSTGTYPDEPEAPVNEFEGLKRGDRMEDGGLFLGDLMPGESLTLTTTFNLDGELIAEEVSTNDE